MNVNNVNRDRVAGISKGKNNNNEPRVNQPTESFDPDMALHEKTGWAGYRNGVPVYIHRDGTLQYIPRKEEK